MRRRGGRGWRVWARWARWRRGELAAGAVLLALLVANEWRGPDFAPVPWWWAEAWRVR